MSLRAYRVKAGFSILLQMLRIPLAVALVDEVSALHDYFIVTAAAIPFQFIASEFLLYRGLSWQRPGITEGSCLLIAVCSMLVFMSGHDDASTLSLLIFATGLIANAVGLQRIRNVRGASTQVSFELGAVTFITLLTIPIALHAPSAWVSVGLLGVQALAGGLIWLASRSSSTIPSPSPQHVDGLPNQVGAWADRSFLFITLLMGASYMERMYLSLIQPSLLGSISLAAAAAQVWRRLTLDDALLFESLKRSPHPLSTADEARRTYLHHAWLPVGVMSALCLVLWLAPGLTEWMEGFMPAAKMRLAVDALAIANLYIASLPAAVPVLNLIRAKIHQPSLRLLSALALSAVTPGLLMVAGLKGHIAMATGVAVIFLNSTLWLLSAADVPSVQPAGPRRSYHLLYALSCLPPLALLNSH